MSAVELVRSAKAGDRAALDELFGRNYKAALRFAASLTHCREAAQDLTQTAFLRIWEYLPRLEPESEESFRALLFTILKRTEIKRWKAAKCRVAEVKVADRNHLGELDEAEYLERIADNNPDPFRAALGGEIAKEVLSGWREDLTPTEAKAFWLRHAKGLLPTESAEMMGCSPKSANSSLRRAQKKMRCRLEPFR